MHGTPAASAALETGTTTSGVEVASSRSTFELLISCWVTIAEVAGTDCASFSMMSTL
jgi:hypothetical protein